jgi:hypothetical protein
MKKIPLFSLVGVLICLPNFIFAKTTEVITDPNSLLQILTEKVDLLSKINDRTLTSVYWTLGVFSTIFLALISVNLYFNITANKREILKIRKDIKDDTQNTLNEAESRIEKVLAESTNLEIEKSTSNTLNILRNEALNYQVEINKRLEESDKLIAPLQKSIKDIENSIAGIKIDIKELEAFMYSQKGKMGGIFNQIELLEYDIVNRPWYLPYRLEDIKKELEGVLLSSEKADKLNGLLDKVKDSQHSDIIKEIRGRIRLERNPPKSE